MEKFQLPLQGNNAKESVPESRQQIHARLDKNLEQTISELETSLQELPDVPVYKFKRINLIEEIKKLEKQREHLKQERE